ncbi:WecB/TagA/CpsF family glycosyltransferase [Pseudonocardia sp. ICBG1034]|uniref:WecB/TagA/CpsF family glycosyltransferase n=1 Tax=Pseudonocardia sp. ICBG1034 TaxID=2844381 RepID=UPI001CCA87F4|nr:WecB/TagA/CpsF family glycosyltransferase [Pseudonocardia sp. ICBG1034]
MTAGPAPDRRVRDVLRPWLPTVRIAGIDVVDLARRDLVDRAVDAVKRPAPAPTVMFALHVGGLNETADPAFVRVMNAADFVYADGMSVVLLGRLAGARWMERTTTTDVGPEILERLAFELGRPPRVAIVGGPPGLAERAVAVLSGRYGVLDAGTCDGYRDDYTAPLAAIGEREPDLLVVAMGMPREAEWVRRHRAGITAPLVLTAGGLLGFLTGDETRAPRLAGRTGLEWVWRLAQRPALASRYGHGALTVARLALRDRRTTGGPP